VVAFRNYFKTPWRVGDRFVELLLVVKIQKDRQDSIAHVCEIRLEELSFHRARETAAPHLSQFLDHLCVVYDRACTDPNLVEYLARTVLESPSEGHGLRLFRRHLARRFGSCVCGWRCSVPNNSRWLSFGRFRDICHALKCREHAPEYWSELDSGRGGVISLFELDPEAVAALAKFRLRVLMLIENDTVDTETLFAKLTWRMHLITPGRMELHEFRSAVKAFGLIGADADRVFSYLDHQGGSHHNPPASVTVADFDWLRRLPTLVDTEAVLLSAKDNITELEALRTFNKNKMGTLPKTGNTQVMSKNSRFDLRHAERRSTSPRRRSNSLRRSSSLGPHMNGGGGGSLKRDHSTSKVKIMEPDSAIPSGSITRSSARVKVSSGGGQTWPPGQQADLVAPSQSVTPVASERSRHSTGGEEWDNHQDGTPKGVDPDGVGVDGQIGTVDFPEQHAGDGGTSVQPLDGREPHGSLGSLNAEEEEETF